MVGGVHVDFLVHTAALRWLWWVAGGGWICCWFLRCCIKMPVLSAMTASRAVGAMKLAVVAVSADAA